MENRPKSLFRPLILFVEDDLDFFIITRYALEQAGFWGKLKIMRTTDQTMRYLQVGETPSLIILDLNNSPNEWRECLAALKKDQRYREIPTAVLLFPCEPKDIAFCESHPRCSYFERPGFFEEWRDCMEVILWTYLKAPSL